jgi:hypothetical protein
VQSQAEAAHTNCPLAIFEIEKKEFVNTHTHPMETQGIPEMAAHTPDPRLSFPRYWELPYEVRQVIMQHAVPEQVYFFEPRSPPQDETIINLLNAHWSMKYHLGQILSLRFIPQVDGWYGMDPVRHTLKTTAMRLPMVRRTQGWKPETLGYHADALPIRKLMSSLRHINENPTAELLNPRLRLNHLPLVEDIFLAFLDCYLFPLDSYHVDKDDSPGSIVGGIH